MKWVTRSGARVDRIACPWLIRRFIDDQSEFLFVPAEYVQRVAEKEDATPFDAPGLELGHRDGKCTFEVIIENYGIRDAALDRLALIVHCADIPGELGIVPEAAGLLAFSDGLHETTPDDNRKLTLAYPLYDALYIHCKTVVSNEIEGS